MPTNERSMLWRAIAVFLFAWFIQIVFLIPLVMFGQGIVEHRAEKFMSYFAVDFVIVTAILFCFFIPSLLIYLAARSLTRNISSTLAFSAWLQPVFLLGVGLLFAGIVPGLVVCFLGYLYIRFLDWISCWLRLNSDFDMKEIES